MMKLKTVTIDNNGEPLVINATDFRRGSDKLWDPAKESDVKETASDDAETQKAEDGSEDGSEDTENEVAVTHKGGGRWIVTVNGEQVHENTLTKEAAMALAAEY